MGRTTIKQVADMAGVGVGTVSRIINSYPNIKPQTRIKVEAAIKKLNYRPDSIARSLRTNQSKTIAFLVTDISNIAFSAIAKGLHSVLDKNGYNLLLYNLGNTNIKEKIQDFFTTKKIDGAVLAIPEEKNPDINRFLDTLNLPLVSLDREIQGIKADTVYTDYYNGIRKAVEHLLELGHTNIGFVTGSEEIRPCRESIKGYVDALKLKGLEVNFALIRSGEFTKEFGMESVDYFAQKIKRGEVTALIAGSYPILVGVIEGLQLNQISLPDHVSLVSFEDSDLTRLMTPAITVIKRPLDVVGTKIAHSLLERLPNFDKDKIESSSIIIPTELVVRNSTQPHRPGHKA